MVFIRQKYVLGKFIEYPALFVVLAYQADDLSGLSDIHPY